MKFILIGLLLILQAAVSTSAAPLGKFWERVDAREGSSATSFVAIGNSLVAVGDGGSIWRTEDRENWVPQLTSVPDDLKAITHQENTLIAVGANGRILRCASGSEWTAEPSGVTTSLNAITYGAGTFVAAGANGTVIYSTDGRRWLPWPTGATDDLNDILWDGSRFFAVGKNATLLIAEPGGTWVRKTVTTQNSAFHHIVHGSTGYAIDGRHFSTNGNDWESSGSGIQYDLAYGAGVFVGVRDLAGMAEVSPDGKLWSLNEIQLPTNEILVSVEWTGSEFIAMSSTLNLHTSPDGHRWRSKGLGGPTCFTGCWTGTQYVSAGVGGIVRTSPDGQWWTTENSGIQTDLYTSAAGGGNIVLAGQSAGIIHSKDGVTWDKVVIPGTWDFQVCHWTGNQFIMTGTDSVLMTSPDGINWTARTAESPSTPGDSQVPTGRILSMATANGITVAALQKANEPIRTITTSVDGINWNETSFPEGGWGTFAQVLWTGTQFQIVGSNATFISSDATTWSMGPSPSNDIPWYIRSAAWFNNQLIVGGEFESTSPQTKQMIYTQVDGNLVPRLRGSGTIIHFIEGPSQILALGTETYTSPNGYDWKEQISRTPASNLNEVVHTPWGFFAVSSAGVIWQSADGEDWTKISLPDASLAYNLSWANGQLFASGFRSIDGTHWEKIAGSSSLYPSKIIWNGSRYVGISNGRAQYSDNGVTWTFGSSSADVLNSIVWTGSDFMATTSDGAVLRSENGSSWHYTVIAGRLLSSAYGNGVHMVSSSTGKIYRSTDGETWKLCFLPSNYKISGFNCWVEFAGGKFFLLNTTSPFYSTDGVSWSKYNTPTAKGIHDIIWTGNTYLGVDYYEGIYKSIDGINWSIASRIPGLGKILWNGNEALATGGQGKTFSSPTGDIWTAVPTGREYGFIDIAWTGTQYVAIDGAGLFPLSGTIEPLPTGLMARQIFMIGDKLVVLLDLGRIAILENGAWNVFNIGTSNGINYVSTLPSGEWIATGDNGTIARHDPNARVDQWEILHGSDASTVRKVLAAQNGVVTAGLNDGLLATSSDGKSWHHHQSQETLAAWNSANINSDIVVVGSSGKIGRLRPDESFISERSGTHLALYSVASSGTRMVAVGEDGVILLSKPSSTKASYEQWIDDQGADGNEATANHDPNADGIENLVAYAFGLPATDTTVGNDRLGLPSMIFSQEDSRLAFDVVNDIDDVELHVQQSFDMKTWSNVAVKIGKGSWGGSLRVIETSIGSGKTRATVLDDTNPESGQAFYRMKIKLR